MGEMHGLLDSEVAQRRLHRLASHLCNLSLVKEEQLSRELCAKLIKRPVNSSVLANLMAGMSLGCLFYLFSFKLCGANYLYST